MGISRNDLIATVTAFMLLCILASEAVRSEEGTLSVVFDDTDSVGITESSTDPPELAGGWVGRPVGDGQSVCAAESLTAETIKI